MAYSVFPERMDKLDKENPEQALGTIENYINYMLERVEFTFTNIYKTVQGTGVSTAEILAVLAALSNSLSALTGTVNALGGTVTGLQTTVGGHTIQIGNLENGKQDLLTFDATPTDDSTNPVTSDGIYTVDEGFDTRITNLEDALSSSGPILYSQPQDQTVALGESAVFSVQVLGASTYKWEHYYSSTWVEVGWTGHDTAEVTTPGATALMDGRQIRCTITGGGWTIVSQVATLHVE